MKNIVSENRDEEYRSSSLSYFTIDLKDNVAQKFLNSDASFLIPYITFQKHFENDEHIEDLVVNSLLKSWTVGL